MVLDFLGNAESGSAILLYNAGLIQINNDEVGNRFSSSLAISFAVVDSE